MAWMTGGFVQDADGAARQRRADAVPELPPRGVRALPQCVHRADGHREPGGEGGCGAGAGRQDPGGVRACCGARDGRGAQGIRAHHGRQRGHPLPVLLHFTGPPVTITARMHLPPQN
eukprot:815726-Pyramimonas_sp.AAC.1